jgi:hypothetical protein
MLACPNAGLDFLNAASVLVLLTPLSFGLLTIPAYLAVRRLVRRRFSPALVRGTYSSSIRENRSLLGSSGFF